jgi:DNA polymerase V
LRGIFRPGYEYKKAGVILVDLSAKTCYQQDLFFQTSPLHDKAMNTLDQINNFFGKEALQFAAQGLEKPWKMRRMCTSPHFTTNWNQLLTIGTHK